MPIKRLQRDSVAFPRIGVLRKGAPKGDRGPGQDLDYFRFDSNDAQALRRFAEVYGERPTQINVYLPYRTVEENFQCWQEAYTAGALQHRCDGETCVIWLGKDGKYHQEPKPCPGGCKEVGRLRIIIPELARLAYVTVETHSINDIIQLTENLQAAEALRGNLQGIPFILSRRERAISTPSKDGKRARRTVSLLSIEPHPDWVRLQLEQMHRQALPSPMPVATQYRLVDKSTGEILDGDYQAVEYAGEDEDNPFDGIPAIDPDSTAPVANASADPVFTNPAQALAWAVEIKAYSSLEAAGEGFGFLRSEVKPRTDDEMYAAWVQHCRKLAHDNELLAKAMQLRDNIPPVQDNNDRLFLLRDEFLRLGEAIYGDAWPEVCARNAKRVSQGRTEDWAGLTVDELQKLIDGLKKLKRQREAA